MDRCRSGNGVALCIDLSDPDFEFLCIEIQKPFLLSNWYIPPNTLIELFDNFEVLVGMIEAENITSNTLGDDNREMKAIMITVK